MLRAFVPFRSAFRQPVTLLISLLASGLSFFMTLRFCRGHWPDDARLLVAVGLLWELSKLHLGARGLRGLVQGRGAQRVGGLGLLSLALLLAAGSVGASLGCLVQGEAKDRQRALASSHAYASAVSDLDGLDKQIDLLTESAARDLARDFRKRSIETTASVARLRIERKDAALALRALEGNSSAIGATLLDGGASPFAISPNTLKTCLHFAVALLLEVIGIVAMFLLESPATPVENGGGRERRNVARRATGSSGQGKLSAPLGTKARPLPAGGPEPCRVSSFHKAPAPTSPRPYTLRLQYRFGNRMEGILNQLAASRRYENCRDLVRAIGDYCLRIGGTDGCITEAQIRTLNTAKSWRATQGYLDLLASVGGLLLHEGGSYELAYFLDDNPSVEEREAFAHKQREQNLSRKHHERQRISVESTSNQHISEAKRNDISITYDTRHAEPTIHMNQGAQATTHFPTASDEERGMQAQAATRPIKSADQCRGLTDMEARQVCNELDHVPWAKYLSGAGAEDHQAAETAARDARDIQPTVETSRSPRKEAIFPPLGTNRRGCIPAKISADTTPVNLHSVLTALRAAGIDDDLDLADATFSQLSKSRTRNVVLRYAVHCLNLRRQRTQIKNPLAYLLAIVKGQEAAAAA